MVLVKAAPVLTSQLQESMCVAGMTLEREPAWIRLHPVPFRDLDDDSKFRKYQEIAVRAVRPKGDRRPESWTPLVGSIELGQRVGTDQGWSTRRERVDALDRRTMCELIELNHSGSGPGTPSLAVVRAKEPPELLITKRDDEQLARWKERADAIRSQPSLFDDPSERRSELEIVPWRFRYAYRCVAADCPGHKQTIVDWEVVSLWRNVRDRSNWQELMRQKFVDELWGQDRETVIFAGNMHQYPRNFLILGIFWPPKGGVQTSLLD